MTWVVGANVGFGTVLMASDIRIMLPDKSEHDALHKIYPLSQNIIGGFAGSVDIGLDILDQLTAQFLIPARNAQEGLNENSVRWIARFINRHFNRYSPALRALKASFLLGSSNPQRTNKFGLPETKLYAFLSSNKFQPEEVLPGAARSIGSGIALEAPVMETLRTRDFQMHWNAGPEMHSFILATHLRDRVLSTPIVGVSPQFTMGWAAHGKQSLSLWATLGTKSTVTPGETLKLARSAKQLDRIIGRRTALAVG
ncbi:hypothetical protein [Corallococcus sp. CA047B]|uniref:hypothetical protein n=1 Tax=Corallococcus sp. CA047B TaxID=2316729 RepID=UPI0011C3FEDB|nr:hypothetical protein [Corallococcus sp. CA047B]